jgi:acetyltransferase-like isoleucine patch superfamily enzyme
VRKHLNGSVSLRLYQAAMGVDRQRLLEPSEGSAPPRLRDVVAYACHKGIGQLVRGTVRRPWLGHCGGRFFVGRHARILFAHHLRVGHNVAIGDHAYLNCLGEEGVCLGANVRVKEYAWIQVTSHLSHRGLGLRVGANTYIGPHCLLGAAGGIVIEDDVTLGAYVQLLAENHRFDDPDRPVGEQGVTRRGIRIGSGSWLGNSVIVLDGVTVGPNAVIGAGSVVTRDVPSGAVVAGNPARVIRQRATPRVRHANTASSSGSEQTTLSA